MADKGNKGITIIKKKKGGAHGGAHGGAWKVAYADFVTAMMAFFMVMWLMGSDEETKAEIAHYFNHPNTPWKSGADPESNMARPLGDKRGTGDMLLNGMNGANPDDLVPNPSRPVADTAGETTKEISEAARAALDDLAYGFELDIDMMRFSIADSRLFKEGTTELKPEALTALKKVGNIVKGYSGFVTIQGHVDNEGAAGRSPANQYEFSMSKSVTVMKLMMDQKWISEDRVFPRGLASERKFTQDDTPRAHEKNQRIEFVLHKQRRLN